MPYVVLKCGLGRNRDQSLYLGADGSKSQFYDHDMFSAPHLELTLTMPKGAFNMGISTCNRIYADSNDSANWWRLSIPLPTPKGKWKVTGSVKTDEGTKLTLTDSFKQNTED